MRFKTATRLAKNNSRYIQRENGRTLFDVVKYQPSQLDQEDIIADDWNLVPTDEKVRY